MRIPRDRLARALREAFGTPEQELVCSECSSLIPVLVDTQLRGDDPATRHPDAWIHLQRCPDCREEYEELLEIMRLVEADALPEPEAYPSFELPTVARAEPEEPPRSWLDQARQTMAHIAARVRQGYEYTRATVHTHVEEGIETITFALMPARVITQPVGERGRTPARYFYELEDLGLEITIGMRAFEPGLKTVKGQLFLSTGDIEDLAGVPVHLARDEEPYLSTTVDDTGSFTFLKVPPGRYRLILDLGDGKMIRLEGLEV